MTGNLWMIRAPYDPSAKTSTYELAEANGQYTWKPPGQGLRTEDKTFAQRLAEEHGGEVWHGGWPKP